MGRKRHRSDTPMEQDSFLDIVANLVGILIILIVIVGTQIGESLVSADSNGEDVASARQQLEQLEQQAQELKSEVVSRTGDHQQWEKNLISEAEVTSQRQYERDLMLRQLATVEAKLEQEKQRLSEEQRQALALRQELAQNQAMQEEVKREIQRIQHQQVEEVSHAKPEVIEHYPTPIAKTVFGDEVHFHLKDGYLVYAPLNELVARMRATCETHARDIPPGQSMIETVGPIMNFRLQYELICQQKTLPTAEGVIQRSVVSLKAFDLLPNGQRLGEPVAVALQPDSRFSTELKNYSPQKTTVSVWLYPECYGDFLEIRKQLIQKGFRVAVWPLVEGQFISGSPDGLHSSAQ